MRDGSSWANLCAANNETNGVDVKTEMSSSRFRTDSSGRRLARSEIVQSKAASGIGLPTPFVPTLPTVNGSEGVIKNYILPDGKTGVVSLSSPIDVVTKRQRSSGIFWYRRCSSGHSAQMTTTGSSSTWTLLLNTSNRRV